MEIKDIDGKVIKITNIDAAIKRVNEFVSYNKGVEITDGLIKKRHNYWLDIQKKLYNIKTNRRNKQ